MNESTLDLYGAESKDAFLGSLDKILADKSHEIFEAQVLAMAENETFETQ